MTARYGADATRLYALFAAPPDRDLEWLEEGVAGISRFLSRVHRLVTKYSHEASQPHHDAASLAGQSTMGLALLRKLHQTIARITLDFSGRWHFNTSIAALMELVNEIVSAEAARDAGEVASEA